MLDQARRFAEKLNKALDDLGMPIQVRERTVLFSKMLHIQKQQAWALLEGHVMPNEEILDKIAQELEVDKDELIK